MVTSFVGGSESRTSRSPTSWTEEVLEGRVALGFRVMQAT